MNWCESPVVAGPYRNVNRDYYALTITKSRIVSVGVFLLVKKTFAEDFNV